jgi:hypothetical protein
MLKTSLMLLAIIVFTFSITGCIIIDGHHGGHVPPGQVKKEYSPGHMKKH